MNLSLELLALSFLISSSFNKESIRELSLSFWQLCLFMSYSFGKESMRNLSPELLDACLAAHTGGSFRSEAPARGLSAFKS